MAARRNNDPNSPQIQAYREAAKLASDNVERGFAAFYRANPEYAADGGSRPGTAPAGPVGPPQESVTAAAERNRGFMAYIRDAVRAPVQIKALNGEIQRVINDVAASLVLNAGNTEPTEEAIKRAASDNKIDLGNLRRTTLNYFKDRRR